jgi:tetratricopeptide (TPR) repeat protein
MTTDTVAALSAAIQASERGDSERAIALLEQLHSRTPDARAAYLLGAEHAQTGAYEAAEAYWREAVRLDSGLSTAWLQLGLLLLTQGRVDDSMTALRSLELLPDADALRSFAHGLQHLARDEFQACLVALRSGMANNTANPALNGDMQRIVDRVQEHLASAQAQAQAADTATGHLFLSAYRDGPEGGDGGGPVRH